MKTFFTGNAPPGQASGGSGDLVGPASATNNALARYDGATGKLLQGGVIVEDDDGALVGVTGIAITGDITQTGDINLVGQLDVDNLRLDGNTLSATNVNGSILFVPNGSGINDLSAASTTAASIVDSSASYWLRSNADIRISNLMEWRFCSGGVTSGADVGLKRHTAGAILVSDGDGAGVGACLTGRVVEVSTAGSGAPNILAITESRKLITNEGATTEAHNTLPSAAAGIEFAFYVQDADGLRVVAGAGDTIRLAGSASAAAGFVRSVVVGSALILTAINATEWVALSIVGTWSVDL